MARPKNPGLKPELLAQIIDYLRDKPLSALTFRTEADALRGGTYMLVGHFGTRDQLIYEITTPVGSHADEFRCENEIAGMNRDQYKAWVDQGWVRIVSEPSPPPPAGPGGGHARPGCRKPHRYRPPEL